MSLPAPTWNELGLQLFPDWIVTRSSGAEEFETNVTRIGKREKRNTHNDAGWQRMTLGGALIYASELLDWNTFRAIVRGAYDSFLASNIRHRRLDNAVFAVGDGETTAFQLCLKNERQGTSHSWPIQYVDHNYPARTFPDGRVCWPTQILQISVDGANMPWLSGWDVDRNTGIVTFDDAPGDGAQLAATGYFLGRYRFAADYAPTSIDEQSLDFEIPDGVELIEVDE